ncbi:hypothetical protein MMC06_001266 [Schaereria dolodes]|nr:hypothetical protein [Schaereria dolodes]
MPQQRSPKASSSRNQQKQRISPSQSRPERLEQRRYSYLVSESESPIYISPYSPVPPSVPVLPSQRTPSLRESPYTALSSGQYLAPESIVVSAPMSAYSSSSQDSAVYSIPGPRQYTFVTATMMSNPRNLSQADKEKLLRSLRTHSVNTLVELRRIEKILAYQASPDITEPMTSAWAHYVNSNNLLSELRGLTKNYPFSSECLDEAKWQVIGDPASTRSWNYCWLVLTKIQCEKLIVKHARQLAVKPAMWGGRTPTAAGVEQLATACVTEWTRALTQLLRHWDSPPTLTGR